MKRLGKMLIVVAVALFGLAFLPAPMVLADGPTIDNNNICGGAFDDDQKAAAGCKEDKDAQTRVRSLINTIMLVVGIIAVVFIIYGAIQYIMSAGDSTKVKTAKHTIQYAIIGLIVVIMSYAIVTFVSPLFYKG